MIFYSIIFVLSLGGIVTIIRRNREEFVAFKFADFMDKRVAELADAWHAHFREQSFNFLEKRLHRARIWVLKTENFLFRTTHRLRGIKEKNGNGNGNNLDDSSKI